jgi:hypothetical protein
MNRRRYLAAVGLTLTGGAAGCVVDSESPDQSADADDDETPDGTDGETADEEVSGSDNEDDNTDEQTESTMLTYNAVPDEPGDGRPIEHDVTVVHSPLRDEERPLTLELTLTNRSDETILYGGQRQALGLDATGDGFTLLAPGGQFYGFEDGWWTKTTHVVRTTEYRIGELEPGESETVKRVVVVDSIEENPTEIPDRIRIELSYSAGTEGVIEKGTSYEWGFELVAENA